MSHRNLSQARTSAARSTGPRPSSSNPPRSILKDRIPSNHIPANRYLGHLDAITSTALFTPPSSSTPHLISASNDWLISVFSVESAHRLTLYRHHRASINALTLLGPSLLLSVDSKHSLCLTHLLTHRLLTRLRLPHQPLSLLTLNPSHFLIGLDNGLLLFYHLTPSHTLHLLRSTHAHNGPITALHAHANRLVTASADATVVVWERHTLRKIATLHPHNVHSHTASFGAPIHALALSSTHIALGLRTHHNPIRIYRLDNLAYLRTIHTPAAPILSLRLLRDNLLLITAADNTLRLHHLDSPAPKWASTLDFTATSCQPLPDGDLILAGDAGDLLQVVPPPHARPYILPLPPAPSAPIPSLQHALAACITGQMLPLEVCRGMLYPALCAASFAEWMAAHKVLMMAVEDGDVGRGEARWRTNLYERLAHLHLASPEEVDAARAALSAAARHGVLERVHDMERLLKVTDTHLPVEEPMAAVEAFVRDRLLEEGDQFRRLKLALELYRHGRRHSQLVGTALQLISIAGTSQDFDRGSPIACIYGYLMEIGGQRQDGRTSVCGKGLIGSVEDMISRDGLRRTGVFRRQRIEFAAKFCEMSVDDLRALFVEPELPEVEKDAHNAFGDLGHPEVAAKQPEPVVEQPEPVVEQPEPVVEQPEPAVEQPGPVVEQPEPAVEQPEPVVEQAEPAAEQPEPSVEQPEPAAGQPEPSAEQTEPIAEPIAQQPGKLAATHQDTASTKVLQADTANPIPGSPQPTPAVSHAQGPTVPSIESSEPKSLPMSVACVTPKAMLNPPVAAVQGTVSTQQEALTAAELVKLESYRLGKGCDLVSRYFEFSDGSSCSQEASVNGDEFVGTLEGSTGKLEAGNVPSTEKIAALWAQFIVGRESGREVVVEGVRKALKRAMEEEDLTGREFLDRVDVSVEELAGVGRRALEEIDGLRVSLGMKSRVRLFVLDLDRSVRIGS